MKIESWLMIMTLVVGGLWYPTLRIVFTYTFASSLATFWYAVAMKMLAIPP